MTVTETKTDDAIEITELEKIEAERVDGVRTPANGTPILMMKALPEAPAGQPAAPVSAPSSVASAPVPIDVAALAKAVAAELQMVVPNQAVADEPKKGHSKKAGRDKEQIESLVSAAVTKATEGAKAELEALRAELAKVRATPIPGGPVTSIAVPPPGVQPNAQDRARKAAEYRDMADHMSDPETADAYRQLARKLEDAAATG